MVEQKIDSTEVAEVAETAAVAAAEASWPQTRAVLRLIFIVLAVAAVIWIVYKLEGVLLLMVLSIFFAYLIAPLVELAHRPFQVRGHKRRIPRPIAIALVYIVLFGSLGLTLYFLLPSLGTQISEFATKAPSYFTSASKRAESLSGLYDQLQLPLAVRKVVNDAVTRSLTGAQTYIESEAPGLMGVIMGYVPWLILIPILAFFLLKDADSFRRSALQMLPRGRMRWRGDELFQDVNSTLAAYIRAQLTACLLIGIICSIGFAIIGLPYWLALGILAGLFEFIPLAGPLLLALLATAVAAFSSAGQAGLVLLFLGILRVVHDYVIYPRIIGQGIHLHPLAIVLAILCGEELAGLAGIFLAIPVIAIISVGYRHWMEHKGAETGIVASLLQPEEAASPSTPPAPPATPVVTTNPNPTLQGES
jgi:predicted PurR-regulated permease PerM